MRCPYCGCMSGGCSYCEEGLEKEAESMEEPSAGNNQTRKENENAYYRLIIGLYGFDPRRKRMD